MKHYKFVFENHPPYEEWVGSNISYLSDDEYVLLSIHDRNIDNRLEPVRATYRQDQTNSAGEIKETQIFPNKELEEQLLSKKQKHWN